MIVKYYWLLNERLGLGSFRTVDNTGFRTVDATELVVVKKDRHCGISLMVAKCPGED